MVTCDSVSQRFLLLENAVRQDNGSLICYKWCVFAVFCLLQPRPKGNSVSEEVLDSFQIEWHGNTVVVKPAASVELLSWDLVEQAADLVMEPLSGQEAPMVIVDLSSVGYFGSVFLALLLRCHKFVKKKGGELVLCGASDMALELLRITALDPLWALYDTREEAMQALLS